METTPRKPAPLQNADNQDIDNKVITEPKTDPSRSAEVTAVEDDRPRPHAATSSDEDGKTSTDTKTGRGSAKVTPRDEP